MQLAKISSRLVTAAAMVAAVACNNSNEGSASVKGSVNGVSLTAQSALFVSTGIQAGNGNTVVGNGNSTTGNGNTVVTLPGGTTVNSNTTLPAHAGVSAQSLMISISNQGDVCSQAGDDKKPANADYLVFNLTSASALKTGTFNLTAANVTDPNSLLPGGLGAGAGAGSSTATKLVPVLDGNSMAPTIDGNSTTSPTNANSTTPSNTDVVATASFVQTDAKCVGKAVTAKSGTVTLTQVDTTGSVEGSFNVTMSTGDIVTGNFKAQSCAPLISSAAAYTCN